MKIDDPYFFLSGLPPLVDVWLFENNRMESFQHDILKNI